MSDYNFTDDPTPNLPTQFNAANEIELVDGSPQGDELTSDYSGSTITVTIVAPTGWTTTEQTFSNGGGSGTLTVPRPGNEDVYTFSYTVEDTGGTKKSGSGVFKVKKTG